MCSDGIDNCSVVIIEGEDLPLVGNWTVHDDALASGGKYIAWEGRASNHEISSVPADIITAVIRITVAGTYRFKWKMRQPEGVESDQANDTWLDFPDATRFGPRGSNTTYPGFTKVYGRADDGVFAYSGKADVKHQRSEVAVEFAEPGPYEIEIAGRSHGHQIDQIIVYSNSISVDTAAEGCRA